VTCEEIVQQLPDHALGTLPDLQEARVRSHLRGCGACRAEAAALDEGLASFGSAHVFDPPPELLPRVLRVLAEEWNETERTPAAAARRGWIVRSLLIAASIVALVGAVTWGAVAQVSSNRAHEDAASYRQFLGVLGGKDVRVARIQPAGDSGVSGSAVLYDGDTERSWVLVLVKAPAFSGQKLVASITSPTGRSIDLFPMEVDTDGEGSTWLISSGDITGYDSVRITDASDAVVAAGGTSAHLGP
jgi:anti-sigma factor RsiW